MTYNDMFLISYVSLVGFVLLTAWTCNIRDWYQRGRIPDFKTSLISSTCLTKLDPELLKNYPFNTSGHSSTKTRNRTSRQFLFFIFHCLSVIAWRKDSPGNIEHFCVLSYSNSVFVCVDVDVVAVVVVHTYCVFGSCFRTPAVNFVSDIFFLEYWFWHGYSL